MEPQLYSDRVRLSSFSLSLSFARSSTLDEVKVPTLKLAETRRRIRR